jgi:hypothetical protein
MRCAASELSHSGKDGALPASPGHSLRIQIKLLCTVTLGIAPLFLGLKLHAAVISDTIVA